MVASMILEYGFINLFFEISLYLGLRYPKGASFPGFVFSFHV